MTIQSIRVPLAYAPKEKFLVRLDQQPSLDDEDNLLLLYLEWVLKYQVLNMMVVEN